MPTTKISIERLTLGTYIRFGKDSVRVIDITFDGSGYDLDLRYGELDNGYEEYLRVEAGGSVEFDGVGEPKLLDEKFVTKDEHDAKFAALMAGATADIANANRQCAEMRGDVPAMIAAE